MKKHWTAFIVLCCSLCAGAQTIDLSGTWRFSMGEEPVLDDEITLPGSMLSNGKGVDVSLTTPWVGSIYDSSFYFNPKMEAYRQAGNIKFPFFLTPEKHYVGYAWYEKSVNVPKAWRHKRVWLHLERAHIETDVYVNGQWVGRDSSLSVPHVFDLTSYLNYGKENKLRIRIYNGIENVCVGQDSHSVTDQTQGCWNGVVGRVEMQARPNTHIASVQIYPDVDEKAIDIRLRVNGTHAKAQNLHFSVGNIQKECRLTPDADGLLQTRLFMGEDVRLWDEFDPNLYTLQTVLGEDTVKTLFGMREIRAEGRQFYLNGRKIWMRGTVENGCFPLTGYPPTDVASWMKIFRKCREYGLNMMRFHSYCPPEAAFVAADSVGFYLQPEGPSWPNHGVRLGRGMSIDRYLMEETQRMVEAYGNHPSFCMLAAGNEPAGDWVTWAGQFVDYWKSTGDNRRLYCGASVGGGWAFDPKSEYHVKGGARGLAWDNAVPQSMDDFYDKIISYTQKSRIPIVFEINEPFLSHEQGQWCVFPDLSETDQYTGAYKARNFEIFKDLLYQNGMEGMEKKFLMASGNLQKLAYKYEAERNLRTPEYAGFQLLSLNDYSGQGTALVGVLNVFWREKGYCTAQDWTQFCAPVVPLAKFPKMVYTSNETLLVDVELYNAYKEPLRKAVSRYRIKDEAGRTVADGVLSSGNFDLAKNIPLGQISLPLAGLTTPAKYTLQVEVLSDNAREMDIVNTWEFWVYPSKLELPAAKDIYIADSLDAVAVETLKQGGKVLLTAAGKVRCGSDVKQHYLPVFWNTSWFKMRPPHTTGASMDTEHPLFRYFPSDDWANLNWWELLNKAQVMNLQHFPREYRPMIQPIDTWHVSRKLAMAIEAEILGGKLFMTTMDIETDLEKRVVARQMRKAILEYMQSEDFRPSIRLSPEGIRELYEQEAPRVDMFTKQSPDELKPKLM